MTSSPPQLARQLHEALHVSPHLHAHLERVAATGVALSRALLAHGFTLDAAWVEAGALLHDIGKTQHPEELHAPGHRHEEAGESLLLARGVAPHLARCCVSHAQWRTLPCALEELVVACADKVWKSVREPQLEAMLLDALLAQRPEFERWETYIWLDSLLEELCGDPL